MNLLTDFLFKKIITMSNKTTGINQIKSFTSPFRNTVLPVAGYATYVIYNGFSLLKHAIKKSTLTHIGATCYCYCIRHFKC